MKPSLLKSNAITPAGFGGKGESQGWENRKSPSRGFVNTAAASRQPVTTRSMARSLFRSEASAAMADRPSPPNPDWTVQSVNVPLPLLRQSAFGAGTGFRKGKLNSPVGGTAKFVKRDI